eukprot:27837_1
MSSDRRATTATVTAATSSTASVPPRTTKRNNDGRFATTLPSFLRHLSGVEVAVELKTGLSIRGTLVSADHFMNLVVAKSGGGDGGDDADHPRKKRRKRVGEGEDAKGKEVDEDCEVVLFSDFDQVHVRGPLIRYVHFPDDLDIPAMVRAGQNRERAAVDRYRRGKRKRR